MTVLDSTKVPLRCHIDVVLYAHAGNLIIFRGGPLRAQIVSPLQTHCKPEQEKYLAGGYLKI